MKSALLGVIGVVLAGLTVGCTDPVGNDPGRVTPPPPNFIFYVSEIDAPARILPGRSLTIVLTALSGGCARFDRIEAERSVSGASLTVWGVNPQLENPGMVCTADLRNERHTVTFDPPFAPTFKISVNRPQQAPLVATVQVR